MEGGGGGGGLRDYPALYRLLYFLGYYVFSPLRFSKQSGWCQLAVMSDEEEDGKLL